MQWLMVLLYRLGTLSFTSCFMHLEPKYIIGIKNEKIHYIFSDPKTWELTPLPNLLLSTLSLYKRKVGISEDCNHRVQCAPSSFLNSLSIRALYQGILETIWFNIFIFLYRSTWISKSKVSFSHWSILLVAEQVSLLEDLLFFSPCSAIFLLFFLLHLC